MKPEAQKRQYQDIELIEKYFDAKLTVRESKLVQKKLKEDPEFKSLFTFRAELPENWLKVIERKYIREEIRRIKRAKKTKEFSDKKQERLASVGASWFEFLLTHKFVIAAFIVLLIGISPMYLYVKNHQNIPVLGKVSKTQVHNPELAPNKGNIDTHPSASYENIRYLTPDSNTVFFRGDQIIFKWTDLKNIGPSHIFITDIQDKSIVLIKEISKEKDYLILEANLLKTGHYSWYINNPKKSRSFTIIDK